MIPANPNPRTCASCKRVLAPVLYLYRVATKRGIRWQFHQECMLCRHGEPTDPDAYPHLWCMECGEAKALPYYFLRWAQRRDEPGDFTLVVAKTCSDCRSKRTRRLWTPKPQLTEAQKAEVRTLVRTPRADPFEDTMREVESRYGLAYQSWPRALHREHTRLLALRVGLSFPEDPPVPAERRYA